KDALIKYEKLEDLSKIMVRLERHILALLLPRDIFKGLDLQKIKKAFQKKKDRQMQLPHYSCFWRSHPITVHILFFTIKTDIENLLEIDWLRAERFTSLNERTN
ncbi:hypothetical protein ACJX0J_038355, partial [Zea mays]